MNVDKLMPLLILSVFIGANVDSLRKEILTVGLSISMSVDKLIILSPFIDTNVDSFKIFSCTYTRMVDVVMCIISENDKKTVRVKFSYY